MQKLGILALVVGLLTVIGALGRTAYMMVTAFTAAQADASGIATPISLTTSLNLVVAGVVLAFAGVVMLIAARRR